MGVSVDFQVNGAEVVTLVPGSVIGRTPMAALHLNDPAISEAHALVSLRGTTLRLLSLRGRFVVAGQRVGDVQLTSGLVVELAPDIKLEVLDVALPATVPGLRIEGEGTFVPPPVASLHGSSPTPTPGLSVDADAVLWVDADVFHLRRRAEPDRTLAPGDSFSVGGRKYTVVEMPLAEAATDATVSDPRFASPLLLVVRFDTVHIWRGDLVTAIDGIPGRILSELALIGTPVEWRTVAREIWPEEPDDRRLRMNWDAGLARLRARLREGHLRSDLVRNAGAGRVELFLAPDDKVTDST